MDNLVTVSDQLMAELEKAAPDRLAAHQNATTALQGQIDLIKSHQVCQDRRIGYALAREAEEADGRSNDRFLSFLLLWNYLLNLSTSLKLFDNLLSFSVRF